MNRPEIENKLVGNGHLIREAKARGRSLPGADRNIILRVRRQAAAAGFSALSIADLEWQGELGRRGVVAPRVEAVFKGLQEVGWARPFRLYDIRGDHPLNNSTVAMMTLVHQWVLPKDVSIFRVALEYLNEASFIAFCEIETRYHDLKKKIKDLSLPGSK